MLTFEKTDTENATASRTNKKSKRQIWESTHSIRSARANREIGESATRPGPEICSTSKTTLPMAINFVMLGQARLNQAAASWREGPARETGA